MPGWLFRLKNEASHSISQKIPIFLAILGKNVVLWDGASGSGSGIRGLVVFFLLFLWPGTILSTLFNSKNGVVTPSHLALNYFKMKLNFGEVFWHQRNGAVMRSIPVVWLYKGSQLLEELYPWDGAGKQTRGRGRDQIPPRAVTQQSKEGCSPGLLFPVQNSKMHVENRFLEQKIKDKTADISTAFEARKI